MDGILSYCLGREIITGALIDTFEYFLQIYELNKEFKFFLLNCDQKTYDRFIYIINDRYDLTNIEDFEQNIIRIPLGDFLRFKLGRVLVVDFVTVNKTRGILKADEVIVISESFTNERDHTYSKNFYKVTYYSEMPFEYKDKEYRMKFLFNRFKPIKNVREGIYVNSPFNMDYSFLEKIKLPNKPIVYKERLHMNNMFEQFDVYLYYHANKWFDPHPRLFHECFFYNKEIMYFNDYKIKDGSYYRYNDLLETGLENRTLSKEDEVVKLFI
jgi:hypothetical protein